MKKEKTYFYYVYIITNNILNKQYVGSHMSCIEPAIDNYWGSSKYLKLDIELYQKENFSKKIIEYYSDKISMLEGESKYIIEYNTLSPNGYNRYLPNKRLGFHMGNVIPWNKGKHNVQIYTTEKLNKLHTSNIGKTRNEETKLRMGASRKGKLHTEETKQKLRLLNLGENNPMWGKKRLNNSIIKNKIKI